MGMNPLSPGNVFCGNADGRAVLYDGLPFCNIAQGKFMSLRNVGPKRYLLPFDIQNTAGRQHFQRHRHLIFRMNFQKILHGLLLSAQLSVHVVFPVIYKSVSAYIKDTLIFTISQ